MKKNPPCLKICLDDGDIISRKNFIVNDAKKNPVLIRDGKFFVSKIFYRSRTVEVCDLCRCKVATNVGASSFSVKEDNRNVVEEMRLRIFVKNSVGIFD